MWKFYWFCFFCKFIIWVFIKFYCVFFKIVYKVFVFLWIYKGNFCEKVFRNFFFFVIFIVFFWEVWCIFRFYFYIVKVDRFFVVVVLICKLEYKLCMFFGFKIIWNCKCFVNDYIVFVVYFYFFVSIYCNVKFVFKFFLFII